MLIQSINANKYQPSFGAIIQTNLNEAQESVATTIKKSMREHLPTFNGETAEGFYKLKGLDFGILPCNNETVSLFVYQGMEEIGRGVDIHYTYSDRMYIGEYDKNSEFRISDIETALKEKKQIDLGFMAFGLIYILGILSISAISYLRKTQETIKVSI